MKKQTETHTQYNSNNIVQAIINTAFKKKKKKKKKQKKIIWFNRF